MRKATMLAHIPPLRWWLRRLLPTAAAFLLLACATGQAPPLAVVPQVDLARYMGTWYEIASYPTWFQRGCAASTAAYALNVDGTVDVLNQCRKDGELAAARGTAWAPDPSVPAKDVFLGAMPFLLAIYATTLIVIVWPQVATLLPGYMGR